MKMSKALLILATSFLSQQGTHAQDLRFRKFNFTTTDPGILDVVEFPLRKESADLLRENSKSASVYLEKEVCTVNLDICREDLRNKSLYPVTHPENKAFWDDFEEVVQVQKHLKDYEQNPCMVDPIPRVMPQMTQYWRGLDILEVAEAVHDEFPGIYHYRMVAEWVANQSVVYDNVVVPKTGQIDFIRKPVMLSDMVGFAFRAVGPCNFSLKWSEGRARPEEVAFAVSKGDITPPEGVVDISEVTKIIEEMNLGDATDFTAYAEGSPTHPSWPAMHSASSASSFWLDLILNLTEEQRCDARMLDWSVAYARTVAGVHYPSDNIAGLEVGQGILAQILPNYLRDEYGADAEIVKKKIERIRFDWTTFEASTCFKEKRFRTVPAARPAVCFDPPKRPLPTHKKSPKSTKDTVKAEL